MYPRTPSRNINYSPRVIHSPSPSLKPNPIPRQSQFLYSPKNTPSRLVVSPKRISNPILQNRLPSPNHSNSFIRTGSPPRILTSRIQIPNRVGSPKRVSRQSSQRAITPRVQIGQGQVVGRNPYVLERPNNVYYQMGAEKLLPPVPVNYAQKQHPTVARPSRSPSQRQMNMVRQSSQVNLVAPMNLVNMQHQNNPIHPTHLRLQTSPNKRQQKPFAMIQRIASQTLIKQQQPVLLPSIPPPSITINRPPSIKNNYSKTQIPTVANIPQNKYTDEPQVSTSVNISRIYTGGFAENQIEDVLKNIEQRLNKIEGKGAGRSSQYFH